MAMFGRSNQLNVDTNSSRTSGFEYIEPKNIYLDTACQTLRPQPVIDALTEYYQQYNACGGRVKYEWGTKVDQAVEATRASILKFVGHSSKTHSVSFTLNTTYGINLILNQLPADAYDQIITSDIEHNSVFLPTMQYAKTHGLKRVVLERNSDGSVAYTPTELDRAIIVLNATSNIDGRVLKNIKELVDEAHKRGSIVIIDGAQTMAHHAEVVRGVDFDALCFSGHKLYAPSLGVVVAKQELLASLESHFIGGGMVSDVTDSSFTLTPDDWSSRLEPGLQAFGEIIALASAIDWLGDRKAELETMHTHAQSLFDQLQNIEDITLFNNTASPVISLHSTSHDAHRLAVFLYAQNIMARSGYFCCHYYLHHTRKSPPLLRLSLGLHTSAEDISTCVSVLTSLHKK